MEIKRCYDTLIGASVGRNQLVQNGDFADGTTGWSGNATLSASDNVLSVTQSESSQYVLQYWNVVANHKCFYTADVKATDGMITFNGVLPTVEATGAWQTIQTITNITASGQEYLSVSNRYATYPSTWQMRRVMRIDLTQMLGSSIADYIYSLETATAGSGISKLREWGFLKGYQAFNAGSIESVEVTGKVVRGFNQWDEEWEIAGIGTSQRIVSKNYIPVIPGATYYLYCKNGYAFSNGVWLYDSNKNLIKTRWLGGLQTIPSNCHYLKFAMTSTYGTTYNHDICINLSSDRNGEYEPYHEYSYDYGNDTLNGIFKLDANNQLYADGDRKTADGTITRYYGTRAYQSGDESLPDAITDGTTTVYKLTTPTTEQGDPFPSPQVCYPDGTEEYVTGNGVPVGHETRYEL